MAESMKLSEEEICECLKSLNVPVKLRDLKSPTKDFVMDVFHIFLKDLRVNIESLSLRPFEAVHHLENPELFEYSQMLYILSAAMTEIVRIISNIPTLTITVNDLIAPKPKRTKRILTYLIIFWNFYLRKYDMFQETGLRLKHQIQRASDIIREIEVIREKHQECLDKLNNMSSSPEELHKLFLKKEEHENNMEKVRFEVVEEYQQLKEKENKILTDITNTNIAIVTVKEKLSELDTLIVKSPEKYNADVQKIKDSIREIEQKIHANEDIKKEKKKIFNSIQLTEEELTKNCNKQQKLLEELQSTMDAAQNLFSMQIKCQEGRQALEDSQTSLEMKETMSAFYAQKLSKLIQSSQVEIDKVTETNRGLKKQISDEEKRCEELKIVEDQLKKNIDKAADITVEVVEKLVKAKEQTEHLKAAFESKMTKMDRDFADSCKLIEAEARKTLGTHN